MFKKILIIIFVELLILGGSGAMGRAETNDNFNQGDWSGGSSASNAGHPADQTGWNKYSSKDTSVNTASSGKVVLSTLINTKVDDTDTDFKGTLDSNLEKVGTGAEAKLQLKAGLTNPFVTALGQFTTQIPPRPSVGNYASYAKAGDYVYAIWTTTGQAGWNVYGLWKYDIANEKWLPVSNLPKRFGPGNRLIYTGGDFLYALRGNTTNEFWRYTISTNKWDKMANLTYNSVNYNIGYGSGLAYVGGQYANWIFCTVGSGTKNFLRYNIATDSWEDRTHTSTPTLYTGSDLVYPGSGNYIYTAQGRGNDENMRGFYRCDVSANPHQWTAMLGQPWPVGNGNYYGVDTYASGVVYPGTGDYIYAWRANCDGSTRGFARYNINDNTWTILANLPMPVYERSTLYYPGSGTKLHFLGGRHYTRVWKFDTTTLNWDQIVGPSLPSNGSKFAYPGSGDYVYLLNSGSFSRYSISLNKWDSLTSPGFSCPYGATMAYYDGYIYANAGSRNNVCATYQDFKRYSISSGTWETLTNLPFIPRRGNDLAGARLSGNKDYIYALAGSGTNDSASGSPCLYRYDIKTNTWEQKTNAPISFYNGAGLYYPGSGDFLYANQGKGNAAFYQYSLSNDTWQVLAPSPYGVAGEASGIPQITGSGDYIYLLADPYYGDTRGYYQYNRPIMRYSIINNTWDTLPGGLPFSNSYYLSTIAVANNILYLLTNADWGMYRYDLTNNVWLDKRLQSVYSSTYGNILCPDGDTVFFMTGWGEAIWKYSISQNKWLGYLKTPFMFSYGTKSVYPGTGNYFYVSEGNQTKYFWRYDFTLDTWEKMADIPYAFNWTSQLTAGAHLIFAAPGASSTKFLQYTIETNTWVELMNFSGDYLGTSYAGNVMVYPGSGDYVYVLYNQNTTYYPIYRYSIIQNSWTAKANTSWSSATNTATGGGSLYWPGTGDFLYAIRGGQYNDFAKYSMTNDTWTNLSYLPRYAEQTYTSGLVYPGTGDFLYALYDASHLAKYSISTNQWDDPNFNTGTSWVNYSEYGSDMVTVGDGDTIYYKPGAADANSQLFYKYSVANKTLTGLTSTLLADTGHTTDSTRALVYPGTGDYVYATRGYGFTDFWSYSILTNSWAALNPPPATFLRNHALCATPTHVYVLRGEGTTTFWRYTISSGWWDTRANITGTAYWGAKLLYPGTGDYIYALRGNGTGDFYRYSIPQDTWTSMAALPVLIGYSHSNYGYCSDMEYPGFGDYIYAVGGSRYDRGSGVYYYGPYFLRYSITYNTWEELCELPGTVWQEPQIMYPGKGDYLYLRLGRQNYNIYRFNFAKFGEYTSEIKDMGKNAGYNTLSWQDNAMGKIELRARTASALDMANAASFTGTAVKSITKGADLTTYSTSITDKHKYFQYNARLFADDLTKLPALDNVTTKSDYFPHKQELISSAYNTTYANNRLMKLSWADVKLSGTDVRFQLRSAADNNNSPGTWSPWYGPTGTSSFNYEFSNVNDYSMANEIELYNGVARLKQIYSNFAYTQRIIVNNSNSYDYSGLTSLNIDPGNSDFWSHIKQDGSDMRFADQQGNLLTYNLISFDYNNKNAIIYVNVGEIKSGQSKTIYLKYGNAAAVSESTNLPPADLIFGTSTAIDANRFSYSLMYPVSPTQVVSAQEVPAVYFITKSKYSRINSATNPLTFTAKIDGSYNSCDQGVYLGFKDTSANTAIANFPYAISFRVFGCNGDGYVAVFESGTERVRVNIPDTARWNDIKIVLKPTTGATYYYRATGDTTWTLLYDSNFSSATDFFVGMIAQCQWGHLYNTKNWNTNSPDFGITAMFSALEEKTTSPSLPDWNYRHKIAVSNVLGSALSSYQVFVTLDKRHEGFWQRCKDDGIDARFVDSDNVSTLFYYRKSFDYANKTATFVVNIPSITAASSKDIFLYYGNVNAGDVSSFDSVFTKDFNEQARNISGVSLDGIGGKVTVPQSAPLDITANVTLEAQVKYDIEYWPNGWSYRKKITLDNTAGQAQTNAVVPFDVPYQAEMKADYADLRFWEIDHSSKLRYGIKSSDASKVTMFVEIPLLPANATKDIYVYYGNATATSESSADLLTAGSSLPPLNGLVAWWKLNEGSGTTTADFSGNGLTANIGSASWVDGKFGKALNTTGGYASVPNNSLFNTGSAVSVAAWIKTDSIGTGYYYVTGRSIYWGAGDYGLYFWQGYPGFNIGADVGARSATGWSTGTWHHLVGTYSNPTIKYYIDGVLVATASRSETLSNSLPFTIGAENLGVYKFPGIIDNVMIYNRALSAAEVMQAMNSSGMSVASFSAAFGSQQAEPQTLKWLPGFGYRKKVTLTNTTLVQKTNTAIMMDVAYVAGHMNIDYSDLRFMNTDWSKLSYAIKSSDGTKATVMISVPLIPANSTKDIYLYYGNASAITESSFGLGLPIQANESAISGWWKFDEGSGSTTADSKLGYGSGTLNNLPLWVTGKFGNGLNFSGISKAVAIPNYNFTNFTVSAWIYPNSSTGYVFTRNCCCESILYGVYFGAANQINFAVRGGSTISGTGFVSGQWYHVTAVKNGTTMTLYKNGVQVATGTAPATLDFGNSGNTYVGNIGRQRTNGLSGNASFDGVIDEVVLLNRALSAQEVMDSFNRCYPTDVVTTVFAAEEAQPIINQTIIAKSGAYELKFTQNGLVGSINGTEVKTLTYDLGKFMHVALIYDGTNEKLYINGTEKAAQLLTGAVNTNSNDLIIGEKIKGAIDEMRVWNVARSAADIMRDQKKNLFGNESGLVMSLGCNENTGTTLNNAALNPNVITGTLFAGAGWFFRPFAYINEKPVALYHMDTGTSATPDGSGNGNTLTLSGTATWSTELSGPGAGQSINFDGSSAFAEASDSATLDLTDAVTIEAWIKPTNVSDTKIILTKGNDSQNRRNYCLYQLNDRIGFSFYNGSFLNHVTLTGVLSAGGITHIVAMYDKTAGVVKIYANGVERYSGSQALQMLANDDTLKIGKDASGKFFYGDIDEVRIYGRALTAEEVFAHYEHRQYTTPVPVNYNKYAPAVDSEVGVYPTTNPVIQEIIGVFYTNKNIAQFSEISNKPYLTEIQYQLSPDGYNWYWHDGSGWVKITGGYSQANIATQINTNLAAFQNAFPSADFYWRAYLHANDTAFATPSLDRVGIVLVTGESFYTDATGAIIINPVTTDANQDQWFSYKALLYSEGQETPILDDVNLEYIKALISVTSPNGSEAWPVYSNQVITWDSQGITGATGKVKLEYSIDNGVNYKPIAAGVANSGTYNWIVPNDPSQRALVKITSEDYPVVSDVSNASFRILSLQVTSPNGGEIWQRGWQHDILWVSTGDIPGGVVKIEYSKDNGSTWNTITTPTQNDGIYPWIVPAVSSDSFLIRISSPNPLYPEITDTSDAIFSVVPVPVITVTAPAGNEQWKVGTQHNITWETNHKQFNSTVDLEYSRDDFNSDVQVIAAGISIGTAQGPANNDKITGSYTWTIPDSVSSSVKMRVKEISFPAGRDTQAIVSGASNNFAIIGPSITITAPVASDTWVVGDTQNITWTSDGKVSEDLLLEYSVNDGIWVEIINHQANSGSYAWIIPEGAVGDNVFIRITDNTRPTLQANTSLKILSHATVKVIQPNGGEKLTIGTSYNITWQSWGKKLEPSGADYNKVSVYYSADNGANWTVAVFKTANTGSYAWNIPDAETTHALIKIIDENDAQVVDVSDSNFEIVLPTITITSPNGGELLYATGNYEIKWSSTGSISNNLKLEYSANNGVTWTQIAIGQANSGIYSWNIADVTTDTALIRVTDVSRQSVNDISNAVFSIHSPELLIVAPNGGEEWVVGTEHEITWASIGGVEGAISDNLSLQYSTNGGSVWKNIAVSEPNDGTYLWTVPDDVSVNSRIKIFDASRPATSDTSDADFKILLPYIEVLAPNGGESWPIGTQKSITWRSVGSISNNLKIEYSKDNFVTAVQIVTAEANDGEYAWTIPDDYSLSVKVRITDNDRSEVTDVSNGFFNIANAIIRITKPNGSELWSIGDTEAITWENVGSVGNSLKIEYSKDNFASAGILINNNAPNTGSYSWIIPNDLSATVRVKITDNNRQIVWDKSDASFTILPAPVITITSPNGAEMWRVGTQKDITWTDNGGLVSNNLTLQYSNDNGAIWKGITTGITNSGKYTWTIPDDVSATCLVKITDASRTSTTDTSNETFRILDPLITITSPNGGEIWAVGDKAPVSWTSEGAVSNSLLLEYSPDGGANYYFVANVSNAGSYTWTVPDEVSSNALFRISDVTRPATLDVSDKSFIINALPTITITSPNGGEEFVLGDEHNITWTWTGLSISNNLVIESSTDNFVSSRQVIATGVPNTGSYAWVLTGATLTGKTLKIRITDGSRTQVTDMTDGYFRIRGGFTLTSPNGLESWGALSPHTIAWQTRGNIAKVKLEYSIDNGVTWTVIAAAIDNVGSYNWQLPNVKTTEALVRVSDSDDNTVNDRCDDKFSIVYFTVKFNVMDYDTMQHLADFNVSEPSTNWSDSAVNSPITRTLAYPYGTYTTFFSKTSFIDNSATWTSPKDGNSTYVVTVYLENSASAQVTWESIFTYSYAPADDNLNAVGSLQRKGKLVGITEQERSEMGGATVIIYEPDGATVRKTLSATAPNSSGMYTFTYATTDFKAGKVYPATLSIDYRGKAYLSTANIDVGAEILQYEFFTQTAKKLGESVATIEKAVAGGTAQTRQDIEASRQQVVADIKNTENNLKQHVTASETALKSQVISTESALKSQVTDTETALKSDIQKAKDLTEAAMKSQILNTESTIQLDDTLIIRYRTYSGLKPVIDVYNGKNIQEIVKGSMAEIGKTGIYEYSVKFMSLWGKGDFSIVCSESTKGTLDALTISVIGTDIEQVYSQVSAVLGATSGISGLKSVADTMKSQFSMLETALAKIGKQFVDDVKNAVNQASSLEPIAEQLSSLAGQIKGIAGENGALDKLLQVSQEGKGDIGYLKNKTQEIKAAMELSQKMVDNMANKPVTQTWYEYK